MVRIGSKPDERKEVTDREALLAALLGLQVADDWGADYILGGGEAVWFGLIASGEITASDSATSISPLDRV